MTILYIIHYGYASKSFFCDKRTGKPIKIIGDGGTNIHFHLIKFFSEKGIKVNISTFDNNYKYKAFFPRSKNVKINSFWTPQSLPGRYNFFADHIYKTFFLPIKAYFMDINYDYVFSATDFFPDALFAFLVKIRNPKIVWTASYFLEAPKPWTTDNPYRRNLLTYLTGFLYWFMQCFSFWLINWKADFVLVTSLPDVDKFISRKRDKSKIIIVRGGVDISQENKYSAKTETVNIKERKYDACFIGRFHYQKGVIELIDIWTKVCQKKPNAKLAMIGSGPLESEVNKKINESSLKKNIDLLGFKCGKEKIKIIKNSKIIVHPATYDSGGMAAAEGMAWGLPGVSFDLEALKTYYPKGMLKASIENNYDFADKIIKLLENPKLYKKMSIDALELIFKDWDWEKRLSEIYKQLNLN